MLKIITKVTITPKFNVREIVDGTIEKEWLLFQAGIDALGMQTLHYMKHYINNMRRRQGGSGRLARAMSLKYDRGMAYIGWGIGLIPILNTIVPYWYFINYGISQKGMVIPGRGKFRPILFRDGRADPNQRGTGDSAMIRGKRITSSNEPMPSPIRPMNYIEATRIRLDWDLSRLIARLKVIK